MLLDVSDEKTVFQSGLNYKVIQTLGRVELGEDDILELRYMTLDSDEQKASLIPEKTSTTSSSGTTRKITRRLTSVMPATSPLLSISTSAQGNNI